MRFHIVGLPHAQTTTAYSACAFSQKVIGFCRMMKARGHHVTLYAGEQNEAPCDEHVPCISEARRRHMVGDRHYTEADWGHPYWQNFNANVVGQMAARIEPHDFICLIGGLSHKPIADAFPRHVSVEFGIGYPATFAKYRVWESYAWMHAQYAVEAGGAGRADGHWFDAVIPGYLDPGQFPYRDEKDDYFLFVGRLIDRKGYRIAQEVCERLGKRLILAGPGPQEGYGEFVGTVGPEERNRLMAGARALFVPTIYLEPFGNVAIEAMACGTPVICTPWGAMTETVIEGVTGFHCHTFKEFCAATEKVDGLDRSAIRRHVVENYSLDVIGAKYEAYFERLSSLWTDGWYAGVPSPSAEAA